MYCKVGGFVCGHTDLCGGCLAGAGLLFATWYVTLGHWIWQLLPEPCLGLSHPLQGGYSWMVSPRLLNRGMNDFCIPMYVYFRLSVHVFNLVCPSLFNHSSSTALWQAMLVGWLVRLQTFHLAPPAYQQVTF